MAEPFDSLIGVDNPRTNYNPTGGVVQLPGQGGAPGAYTVDPGAAMSSYLDAFSPELLARLLEMEASYAPKFSELDLAARGRNIEDFMSRVGGLTRSAADIAKPRFFQFHCQSFSRPKRISGTCVVINIGLHFPPSIFVVKDIFYGNYFQ